MAASSKERALAGVRAIWERYNLKAERLGYNGFDRRLMSDVEIIDASIGAPYPSAPPQTIPPPSVASSATFSLHISPAYCNLNGVMHGGAAGGIFDMCTTSALGPIARPGFWEFLGGVTRTLNISYLKAVPEDTTVHIHAHVYQVGKRMAYIKGWMTSEDGKTVYCMADHHKVYAPRSEPDKDRIPWDDQFDHDSKL